MKIGVGSGNKDKLVEIRDVLGKDFEIFSPEELGIEYFDVDETGETLEENAYLKAKALYDLKKIPTIADDTGLFVNALGGEPGIYSHRYAGENPTYKDNREKLLRELYNKSDRSAYFETAICFIDEDGRDHYFLGRVDGQIAEEDQGEEGFGYDMIFIPKGTGQTYAQMGTSGKDKISHRYLALCKLRDFLIETYGL